MGWPLTLDPRAWDSVQQMVVGAVAVILLLVLLAVVRGRRRRAEARAAQWSTEGGEIRDSRRLRRALEETLIAYRKSHPLFYQFLTTFQEEHALDDLFEHEEVDAAFARLTFHRDRQETARSRSTLHLDTASAGKGDREIRAAMVTILRALYLKPEFRRELTSQAVQELDTLLDSLTQ